MLNIKLYKDMEDKVGKNMNFRMIQHANNFTER